MNEIIATIGGLVLIGYFIATLVVAYHDGIEIESPIEFI